MLYVYVIEGLCLCTYVYVIRKATVYDVRKYVSLFFGLFVHAMTAMICP
jgi:hypothetical protein